MELPKYNKQSKKGEDGITIIRQIIEKELNWIFRPNHKEHDFGIDAYLDIITELGYVTGKTIAAQVKTGPSYFKETNNFGWVYRGEMSHLNYYLNHDIPVVIIIVNEEVGKAFWCLCDPSKTEKAGENWKIIVPFYQELASNSKNDLLKYISPVNDYASQLDHFWELNSALKSADKLIFAIEKEDIEKESYDTLLEGLKRLQVNEELLHHFKEKVDILIFGYENDERELRDIPEVREWVDKIFEGINGWAYYLIKDETSQFLKVLMFCKSKHEVVEKRLNEKGEINNFLISVDIESLLVFLEELYHDLNVFIEKFKISEDINEEVSMNLHSFVFNDKTFE